MLSIYKINKSFHLFCKCTTCQKFLIKRYNFMAVLVFQILFEVPSAKINKKINEIFLQVEWCCPYFGAMLWNQKTVDNHIEPDQLIPKRKKIGAALEIKSNFNFKITVE